MNCSIYTSPEFEKTLKGLAKHYPSVKEDYRQFLSDLRKNPFMGTQLGNNLRKVRYDKSERNTISDKELKQLLKNNNLI